MRLAFIRAGTWFFASILIVLFFFGKYLEGKSTQAIILTLIGIGFLFGGLIFFITWYGCEKEERELGLRERRKALEE